METIRLPAKKMRAELIAEYIAHSGYSGVVCFSCGNASAVLKEVGLDVLDVSSTGSLEAKEWWAPAEIHRVWPNRFDATSGHLPVHLMVLLAKMFREFLGLLSLPEYLVPTGSGETIICLRWAYPDVVFHPEYGEDCSVRYEEKAPLNFAVDCSH